MGVSPAVVRGCGAVAAILWMAVVVWTPPGMSFVLAVATALGWCAWLERPPLA